MIVEITPASLATLPVAAFLTAVMIQLVKPSIEQFKERQWYRALLNLMALVFGVGFALAGGFVNDLLGTAQNVTFYIVIGIVSAFLAVYGYEAAKSIRVFTGGQESES